MVYLCMYDGTTCAFKAHLERGPRLQIRTNRIVGSTVWIDLVSDGVGLSLSDKWRYFQLETDFALAGLEDSALVGSSNVVGHYVIVEDYLTYDNANLSASVLEYPTNFTSYWTQPETPYIAGVDQVSTDTQNPSLSCLVPGPG